MPATNPYRLETLIAAALFSVSVSIIPVLAAGDISPPSPPPAPPPASHQKPDSGKSSLRKKHQHDQHSQQEEYQRYVDGYQSARALVLGGKYAEAIAAFRALQHDDSAEVANYVGYAYRKLGDYDLAKFWYDKALDADPNHVRTWEYYGMWHVEQGNVLKAKDFLEKVHVLCGNTSCPEYVDLNAAIEGRMSY